MKKRRWTSLALAMLMTMSLAACGGGEDSEEASSGSENDGTVFKVGSTSPLTGSAAIYGNAVKNGAQIAVDEINAEGGPIQFEFRCEDDVADPEKAVNAYNKLKDWGMQLSLGSTTSKCCEAVAAEVFADRIFALTPSASSTATTSGKDNMFQLCYMDPNLGAASAQYIANKNLATKVAVIWKNDDVYCKGVRDAFMAKAEELRLDVVSEMTFADGNDTDFSVQLTDAKNNGAELVYIPIYYQPASLILSQANSMGYAPKWFGVDGLDGLLTMKGFDTAMAEGVMLLTPFNADDEDEKTTAFVAEYQERFGEVPNQFAADAYDCIYAYKQALETAGATPDMSAEELCGLMMEQFTSMTYSGLTGENMTWNAEGAVTKDPKGMMIHEGAYVGLD